MHEDHETTPVADEATVIRPLALAPGALVSNRYELESLLGRGGFGAVFKARDRLLGRAVALKTIALKQAGDGAEPEFLDEARTIAKLDHEHIVPVFDVGTDGDNGWIAMKLIEGEPLSSILKQRGALERSYAIALLTQAAAALDAAHRRGIIHRDVKPQNILVETRSSGPHAWLADFGIAKILSGATTSFDRLVIGTPGYMAPEQVSGRRIDARTDVFSLGCVALECFTGMRAFESTTFDELVYKVVHTEPAALGELQRRVGKDVEMAIRRALAKSPEDRYQTMEQFRDAISALVQESVPRKTLTSIRIAKRDPTVEWDGRTAVEVTGLSKRYGFRDRVLDGFDLSVPTGAVYALLGRNGGGKTTALRTILGLYRRDAGEVRLFGRDPEKHGPSIMARIGYVPEGFIGYDNMRVSDYLSFLSAYFPNWDTAYAHTLLGRFELPLDKKAASLSRGAQTKLSLVGALAHKPELLVLDDPTLGLDAIVLDEFFETVREVTRKYGTTILIASHNLLELEGVATHLGFMSDGRMMLSDTLESLRVRTREVRLTFRDDPPDLSKVDAFKQLRVSGRRVSGVILDTSSDALARLRSLGPEEIDVRELSLREMFVNLMR